MEFRSRREEQNPAAAAAARRGIATYIEASGAGGFAPYDQVQITWDRDAYITLRATSHSTDRARNDVRADRFRRARRADGIDPAAHRPTRTCTWSAIPPEARDRFWAWEA